MWQDIKNIYHFLVAFLANAWFGFPSKKLTIIGVTGTDGKTTTVNLIYHILKIAGRKASMVSSVGAVINGKVYDTGFHVTTPSSWQLQRFLKKAVREGALLGNKNFLVPHSQTARHANSENFVPSPRKPYLVLEVTSHALDQNRVFGIDFDIGVLTNVTHEHLDYHKTYEEYVKTKFRLLDMAGVVVVNRDDELYQCINSKFPAKRDLAPRDKTQKLITYGIREDAEVNPKSFSFKTNLIGEFNTYNILAAVAACKELGLTDSQIKKGIESFKAPVGRGEIVHEGDFTVMVDFAHTSNALEQLLSSLRPQVKGRIIHVFGSAGERDRQKRPQMGRISVKYADVIILTAEDPRSEAVEKITREIELGITNSKFEIRNPKQIQNQKFKIQNKTLFKIPDRKMAIKFAIQIAEKGDFVVITGKGHERSMNYGKGEVAWSEHEAVKKALNSV